MSETEYPLLFSLPTTITFGVEHCLEHFFPPPHPQPPRAVSPERHHIREATPFCPISEQSLGAKETFLGRPNVAPAFHFLALSFFISPQIHSPKEVYKKVQLSYGL